MDINIIMEDILKNIRAKHENNYRICTTIDEILKVIDNTIYEFDIIDYILCGKSVEEFGETDYRVLYVVKLFDALKCSEDEFELFLIYYALKKIHDDELAVMRK